MSISLSQSLSFLYQAVCIILACLLTGSRPALQMPSVVLQAQPVPAQAAPDLMGDLYGLSTAPQASQRAANSTRTSSQGACTQFLPAKPFQSAASPQQP